MTDKQIIDGVDVSECVIFRTDADTSETNYTNACSIGLWQRWYSNLEPSCVMSCYCKDNPNCYYKQLKRKEQECEELKETIQLQNEMQKEVCKEKNSELDQLKKENEKLKNEIKDLEDLAKFKTEAIRELGKELEATKDLVTVGNKQLTQVLKENEELEKLYKKLEGSCLIGKHWRFE